MSADPFSLRDAVKRLLCFREARDWRQFHRPKELAAAMAIEAAELHELFLWKEAESADTVCGDPGRLERVTEEVADVAIYLLLLAHDLGINLRQAVERKIESNERRYPVEEHRGVAKKAES